MTMVSDNTDDDVFINMGFSKINNLFLYFKTYFFAKEFKDNYKKFIFYHELAHTSSYQRGDKRELKEVFDREAHSDFFALYFVLKDLNLEQSVIILDRYKYFRYSDIHSPNSLYSKNYSMEIYKFFLKNHEKIEYKDSYQNVDKKSNDFVVNIKSAKEVLDITEYLK